MIYLEIFWEFLRAGLFSYGGYGALPFLFNVAELKQWYTVTQLADGIALSSAVPGALGANVSAFAGYAASGCKGAFVAVAAILTPSFVLAVSVSRVLKKFKKNEYVVSAIEVLKPVSCGLLAAAGAHIFMNNVDNLFGVALFGALAVLSFYSKRSPIFILGVCAVVGLLAGFT